jgi:hypothetical protein
MLGGDVTSEPPPLFHVKHKSLQAHWFCFDYCVAPGPIRPRLLLVLYYCSPGQHRVQARKDCNKLFIVLIRYHLFAWLQSKGVNINLYKTTHAWYVSRNTSFTSFSVMQMTLLEIPK